MQHNLKNRPRLGSINLNQSAKKIAEDRQVLALEMEQHFQAMEKETLEIRTLTHNEYEYAGQVRRGELESRLWMINQILGEGS